MNGYLSLQGIHKSFGAVEVLRDIELQVAEGELVTLLGPSGCGKSTLLRCIAGLADVDGGRMTLQSRDLSPLAPRERGVGMVFQSYALFPNLTAAENIEYGMRMHGYSKRDRARRTAELLAMVDLEEKRNAYPHHLSGGQQQRVALARSLAVQPKLLLLDEPLSALDAQIRKNLRAEIRDIQKRFRMTTLFVTHDQEEALTISDRVCIMNKGRIVQQGAPDDVYLSPRTEFVAKFMGSYNVLSRSEALRLFGYVASPAECFALRPESVKLLPGSSGRSATDAAKGEAAAPTQTEVEGSILSISVLGTIIRYTVEAAGVRLTIDALNDGRGIAGMTERNNVRLSLDAAHLLHLEKEGA